MKEKGVLKYLTIGILCLPLFLINIQSTQDWGDDFAGYLNQAKNIAEGKPMAQTGYVQNPEYPTYAPASYPAGFPLLLAGIYASFGINITIYNQFLNLFLIVFALLLFHYLNKYFSALISCLTVLIFIYNPWTLNFKSEIMSDIPFSVLLLLTVLLFTSENTYKTRNIILLILLSGFLIAIRNIGIVFLAAAIINILKNIYDGKKNSTETIFSKKVISTIVIVSGSLIFYFLIDKIFFPSRSGGLFSYNYLIDFSQLKHFLLLNLSYYMAVTRAFFEPWNNEWQFIALLTGTMVFAFIILGMIKKMTRDFKFTDTLVILYMAVILIYPYSNAGFRFMLPLAPFLLHYALVGITNFNITWKMSHTKVSLILALIVFSSYSQGWIELSRSKGKTLEGPFEKDNKEAFNYINENTPANAIFSFAKPRALALFTDRKALTHRPDQNMKELETALLTNNVDFILFNNEVSGDSIKEFIHLHENQLIKVWSNERNAIYRRQH